MSPAPLSNQPQVVKPQLATRPLCLALAMSLVVFATWLPVWSAGGICAGVLVLVTCAWWGSGLKPAAWATLRAHWRSDGGLWLAMLVWLLHSWVSSGSIRSGGTVFLALAGYYLVRWHRSEAATVPGFGAALLGSAWLIHLSLSFRELSETGGAPGAHSTIFLITLPIVSWWLTQQLSVGLRIVGFTGAGLGALFAAVTAPQLVLAGLISYVVYRYLGALTSLRWRCVLAVLTPLIVLSLVLPNLTPSWYASQQHVHRHTFGQLSAHPWGHTSTSVSSGTWASFLSATGVLGLALGLLLGVTVWRFLVPQICARVPSAAPLGFTWLLLATAAGFGLVVAHHQLVIVLLLMVAWSKPGGQVPPSVGAPTPGRAPQRAAQRPQVTTQAPTISSVQAQLRAEQRQHPGPQGTSRDAEKVLYLPIADDLVDLVGPPK